MENARPTLGSENQAAGLFNCGAGKSILQCRLMPRRLRTARAQANSGGGVPHFGFTFVAVSAQ
jgi:hypothetical protein